MEAGSVCQGDIRWILGDVVEFVELWEMGSHLTPSIEGGMEYVGPCFLTASFFVPGSLEASGVRDSSERGIWGPPVLWIETGHRS